MAAVPIGKGCDATAYDSELKLAFSSNGEGTLTMTSADTCAVRQTLAIQATVDLSAFYVRWRTDRLAKYVDN